MSDSLASLKQKNEELARLATYDDLTGLLNRRALEAEVKRLAVPGCGLLVCDLNYFKAINDTYGHLYGDQCLKKTGELLTYLMRQTDRIGRIGGDEFVVFLQGQQSDETIDIVSRKIENRFLKFSENNGVLLTISVAGTVMQENDTYQPMFGRADARMMERKRAVHADESREKQIEDVWLVDLEHVRRELEEQKGLDGAFCQDFESFKMIYRYLERSMLRHEQKACVVLLSMENDEMATPLERMNEMDVLERVLRSNLRLGDVYARYSSCQFLVLLTDVTLELSELVVRRLSDQYLKKSKKKNVFLHYSYELQAARRLITGEN